MLFRSIVASPNGRAGIFSLTKSKPKFHTRVLPTYSFQLEYVLPFANDDETKVWDVDGARLIGVATGPVQGMLDKPGEDDDDDDDGDVDPLVDGSRPSSRRWRLMMYFTDHTVLTFELGKRRESEMPEVSELIV